MLWTRRVRNTPNPKLPKTAIDRQEYHGNGTPRVPGVPRNATLILVKSYGVWYLFGVHLHLLEVHFNCV